MTSTNHPTAAQVQVQIGTLFNQFISLVRQNPTPDNPYFHFLPNAIVDKWTSQPPQTTFVMGWTGLKIQKTDGGPDDFVVNVLNKLKLRHMLRDTGFIHFLIAENARFGAVDAFHAATPNATSSFHHLAVRESTVVGAGKGLFSMGAIPKGAVVGVFAGVVKSASEIEYHNNEDPSSGYALSYKSLTGYYERRDKNQTRFTLCDDLKEAGLKAFLQEIDPATFGRTFPTATTLVAVGDLRTIVQMAYDNIAPNMVVDPIFTNTQVYSKDQQIETTGSKMWYVNQAMDGPAATVNAEIRGPDGWKHLATSAQQIYVHLPALVATRDIAAGQEIMTRYNKVGGAF
jgi:hypothetical protein